MRWLAPVVGAMAIGLLVVARELSLFWLKEQGTPLARGLVAAAGGLVAGFVLYLFLFIPDDRAVRARIASGYPATSGTLFLTVIAGFMGCVFTCGVFGAAVAFRAVPAAWDNNPGWLAAFAVGGLSMAWVGRRREKRRLRKQRHLLGLCPACAYDLRATLRRCPECGTSA